MQPVRPFSSHLLTDVLRERLQSYRLTHREEQIVELLLEGLSNKAIAQSCSITEQTVKDHLKHVYRKMGVGKRTALIARLLRFSPSALREPLARDRAAGNSTHANRAPRSDEEVAD